MYTLLRDYIVSALDHTLLWTTVCLVLISICQMKKLKIQQELSTDGERNQVKGFVGKEFRKECLGNTLDYILNVEKGFKRS